MQLSQSTASIPTAALESRNKALNINKLANRRFDLNKTPPPQVIRNTLQESANSFSHMRDTLKRLEHHARENGSYNALTRLRDTAAHQQECIKHMMSSLNTVEKKGGNPIHHIYALDYSRFDDVNYNKNIKQGGNAIRLPSPENALAPSAREKKIKDLNTALANHFASNMQEIDKRARELFPELATSQAYERELRQRMEASRTRQRSVIASKRIQHETPKDEVPLSQQPKPAIKPPSLRDYVAQDQRRQEAGIQKQEFSHDTLDRELSSADFRQMSMQKTQVFKRYAAMKEAENKK